MPDPAIREFFQKRKDDWLKGKVKASMQDDELNELKAEAEEKFSFENWLPDAAMRAGQMSISTHPCTFGHPSARKNKNGYVTSVIAKESREVDGYLKTGNVAAEEDALGNAAVLDVYKFLTLSMQDGDSLLEHIKRDSDIALAVFNIKTETYQNLKSGLLSMTGGQGAETVTSSKLKQVYFPIDNNYHLLSVLSNSGLIYELRKRIDELRFSETQKELRELRRANKYSTQGYSEIYDITTIGYGGTKPQNISVLNNQYGGKARLLSSAPPQLKKRDTQFPAKNFFSQSIRFYDIQEPLKKLDGIFKSGLDSPIPRRNLESGRDRHIEDILDQIIQRMIAIRAASEQYWEESSDLPRYQKVWLCDEHLQERLEEDGWLDELSEVIAKWIFAAYSNKKVIKKPVALGVAEQAYVRDMIETHRDVLR